MNGGAQVEPRPPGKGTWGARKAFGVVAVVVVIAMAVGGGLYAAFGLNAGSGVNSPVPVANAAFSAFLSMDANKTCQFADPKSQVSCVGIMQTLMLRIKQQGGFTGTIRAGNYAVDGDHAVVAVLENGCGSIFRHGSHGCDSNTNANAGLPSGSITFADAWALAVRGASRYTWPFVYEDGRWWVDISAKLTGDTSLTAQP